MTAASHADLSLLSLPDAFERASRDFKACHVLTEPSRSHEERNIAAAIVRRLNDAKDDLFFSGAEERWEVLSRAFRTSHQSRLVDRMIEVSPNVGADVCRPFVAPASQAHINGSSVVAPPRLSGKEVRVTRAL